MVIICTGRRSETGGERLDEAGRDGDPEGGFSQERRWTLWPNLSQDPACYGLTIIAKFIPGREPVFYEYSRTIEEPVFILDRMQ